MAEKIKLTPAELLAQSQEMLSLQKEFEELFQKTDSLLQEVNGNWSANLANNFASKILSTGKAFHQVCAMLSQGGALAASSAQTFESMDSLLAQAMLGMIPESAGPSGVSEGAGITESAGPQGLTPEQEAAIIAAMTNSGSVMMDHTESVIYSVWDEAVKNWEKVGKGVKDFHSFLEEVLPKPLLKESENVAEKILGPLFNAYGVTYDIVTGQVDSDTAYNALQAILGDAKANSLKYAIQYAMELYEKNETYHEEIAEQLGSGNIFAAAWSAEFAIVDEIGLGTVDVLGYTIAEFVEKIPGMAWAQDYFGFDVSDGWGAFMDSTHEVVTEGFHDFVEGVGQVEDAVQDFVGDTVQAVGEGLKDIGDGIKDFISLVDKVKEGSS